MVSIFYNIWNNIVHYSEVNMQITKEHILNALNCDTLKNNNFKTIFKIETNQFSFESVVIRLSNTIKVIFYLNTNNDTTIIKQWEFIQTNNNWVVKPWQYNDKIISNIYNTIEIIQSFHINENDLQIKNKYLTI